MEKSAKISHSKKSSDLLPFPCFLFLCFFIFCPCFLLLSDFLLLPLSEIDRDDEQRRRKKERQRRRGEDGNASKLRAIHLKHAIFHTLHFLLLFLSISLSACLCFVFFPTLSFFHAEASRLLAELPFSLSLAKLPRSFELT
jgi:hypothetical protein